MSFYVMPKYGKNLDSIFNFYKCKFSPKTIFMIGIKLLEIIEKIHEAGYTYNDLKLDNILVGDNSQEEHSLHEIRLVDFGFAARYMTKEGHHIPQDEVDVFRSNMIFATVNQFDFKVTSRRDDLQSLCYLLIYLFQGGDVAFVAKGNMSKKEVFNYIKDVKSTLTPAQLVGPEGSPTWALLDYAKEVFKYRFTEQPNY